MSVAVLVPKARQAVKVSFRIPTMTVVAAPFTASARPPGQLAAIRVAPGFASRRLTIIEKRAKPVITATVATPLGIERRRMLQTMVRSSLPSENGRYVRRHAGRAAQATMTDSPTHVETNPARPAPA